MSAAGAGEEADLHFGQAQAGLGIGGGDAVVAREAEFESAADRSAVDGGDPRLAAGLDAPVEQRELAALLEHHGGSGLFALRARHLGKHLAEFVEHGQVGAGAERVLAADDDRALDRRIARDLLDDRGEFLDHREVDHIHRTIRHVPRHGRDAVRVHVEFEIFVGHRTCSSQPPQAG